ncbi:MAG: PSD1 and planctomycete cytochrome C domain-containing protein [Pirellulaceae bacterium]
MLNRPLRYGKRLWFSATFMWPLIAFFSWGNLAASAEEIDFESRIAPIFEESCVHCHGEDEAESGFRLDRRAAMLQGGDTGVAAIVAGEPDESYLLEVLRHSDPDIAMPPDGEPLSDAKILLIRQWIEEGANWPGQMPGELEVDDPGLDHWAFQPSERPPVPEAAEQPIDAFLLNRLQEAGLGFSPAAAPSDLLRRASIVLTGIAPTYDVIQRFENAYANHGDDAYFEYVDQLLDSPAFGERWAQHWLDVIRWAETNGSEANLYRKNAWVYRDYVVAAFNQDLPYDEFVREQIAGDSLGAGEATGFLVAGPHVPAATVGREPSAIRQARADRMDEVLQTVGASVLGLTVGCARCHNHKFDPLTIRDYYSLTGVFADVEFGSRTPELPVNHPLRKRGELQQVDITLGREALLAFGGFEEDWGAYRELHFRPTKTKAIRIQFKMPKVGLDEIEVFGPASDQDLASESAGAVVRADPQQGVDGRFPAERLIDREFGTMIWRAAFDKDSEKRAWVEIEFEKAVAINRLRLSNNREYYYDTDYLTQKPNLPKYDFELQVLRENGRWRPWCGTWQVRNRLNEQNPQRIAILAKHQAAIDVALDEGPQPSFVGRFIAPAETRVLVRGSPESPRDLVPPAGPEFLNGDLGLNGDTEGATRRLEFANWLVTRNNPLTARVMVNRIWHHVFGTGIVATTSDFGMAGAMPSHPRLLDWLATEFVDPSVAGDGNMRPWSMKRMIRMMVTSEAFRQSSHPRSEAMQADSSSSLLWRFPPKRNEAEVIRDSILQAADRLDSTLGGPSFRIHNVKKTYAQWEVTDNYGPQTWRRMLYQERMRRVDDQIFTAFDFPDCGRVRAKRPVSTTPLQALNLMNSPFVMEQSARIAEQVEAGTSSDQERVESCFEAILGRRPNEGELQDCLAVYQDVSLAAVCRALINSNEFAFLP